MEVFIHVGSKSDGKSGSAGGAKTISEGKGGYFDLIALLSDSRTLGKRTYILSNEFFELFVHEFA